ncbi:MAG TPA: Uma2 family endonuclease [Fimbriiglobus sp.]|nr:Uma2 family endonuclease [Fimbriiglobus sp.]
MPTATAPMTTAEYLALPPDDRVDRLLIAGELREYPMPERNRFHSRAMTRVAKFLDNWLDGQPEPRGQILTGDAGVRLGADPDTAFGVDVTYISAEVMAAQTEDWTTVVGVPVLAVEIVSPGEVRQRGDDKIDAYLAAGVRQVWVLDPHRRTATVYRPGVEPELFNARQELAGGADLPGFRVAVASLFG